MRWNNSNRMLGWDINCLGLKTGYNKRAFGCLVSYFRVPKGEFLVVLIKSNEDSLMFFRSKLGFCV